jgi:mono/diheme cytochrome c family protein
MRPLLVAAVLGLAAAPLHAQVGKAVFEGKGNCHVCHGKAGKGTMLAPDLTDSTWINIDGSVEAIRQLVTAGVPKPKSHPAPMPPMGGAKLTKEEIDAVAAYVRQLAAKPAGA